MTESHLMETLEKGFCPAPLESVGFICFFIQLSCEAYFSQLSCEPTSVD